MKQFATYFFSIFAGLFILTFKFEYSILPEIWKWINPFFESLVQLTGRHVFGVSSNFNPEINSDSIGLYIHVFNLIWISMLLSIILKLTIKQNKVNLRLNFLYLLTLYLSLQLLIYGFDKLFKAQFFFPEPNTLFTPLKDLSKDILYWSTIGMSRSYSMFLGITEILVALFLLFRKTRLIGAILGLGVLINVVMVNFSFDISVKVYSLFLLLGFILILSPYFNYLYQVFLFKNEIKKPQNIDLNLGKLQSKRGVLKSAVIVLFLIEGLFPYFKTNNFNDDTFQRPKFHGAYEVNENEMGIKNVFIHRHGYIIFQNKKDEFQDFQLEVDSSNNQLLVFDYRTKERFTLSYQFSNDSITWFSGNLANHRLTLRLSKVDLSHEEIMKSGFSWVSK